MIVYIPENLDLELLVRRATRENSGPKKDYLAYIIGTVSNGFYTRKNELDNDADISVPMWTYLLKKIVGYNYKRYLDYLIKVKVLTTSRQFFEGKSRRYSFGRKYRTLLKPYEIADKSLVRKIKAYHESERESAARKFPYLHKWIKSGMLDIDRKEAETILSRKFEEKLNKKGRGLTQKRVEELASIALYCWERNIEDLHSKKYILNFSTGKSGGGRLYTTLTHTSRSFRKFLTYNDKPLCHVDIANSQPYFASVLLNVGFWESTMLSSRDKERIGRKIKNSVTAVSPKSQNSNFKEINISPKIKERITYKDYVDLVTLLKAPEPIIYQEFERYKKHVSSGMFYQEVAKEYNESTQPKKLATREDVKNWMFEVFFSENVILLWTERLQSKLFRELFPTVSRIFRILKRDKHNTLAILLQNLESQAVLRYTCRSIAQKHPQIPLFTIHDSIVTTLGNEGIVKEIMYQELERLTGLPPTLRIKIWDEDYDE